MVHQELLDQFVERAKSAAGANLVSVILYGSAAGGNFHSQYSDLNLLCVLRDSSFAALNRLTPVAEWWRKKKRHPPLILTTEELKESAGLFSIELLDMKQRHQLLFGDDLLKGLEIPMHLHRVQIGYELREKLFLLRQHLVLSGSREKLTWETMLNSLSSFTTLFRHVLIELGETQRKHSLEAVQELGARLNFDPSAFVQLIEVRAGKSDRKQLRASEVAARYLAAIETVAGAVEKLQSSEVRRIQ
jgi:hypothetical protein